MTEVISQQQYQERRISLPAILVAQQLVLLPLYFYIPIWITILNILIVISVYFGVEKRQLKLPTWFKVIVTFIGLFGVLFSFHKFTGRDAGVSLIAIMYGLKIVELKSRRDVYILMLLGFFLLLAGFLFNQSPWIAIYQFLPIAAILNALSSIHTLSPSDRFLKGSFTNTIKALIKYLLLAIPMMIILFVFFPRLSGPIWKMPGGSNATSGMSDTMSPGQFSSLRLFDTVAFRVKFSSEVPKGHQLYWRTLVLDHFDGLTWSRRKIANEKPISPVFSNKEKRINSAIKVTDNNSFQYDISLEKTEQRWLTFLDRPITIPQNTQLLADYSVKSRYRLLDRTRYQARSNPLLVLNPTLSQQDKERYIDLPNDGNPRSLQWAKDTRKTVDSDQQYIQAILSRINQQEYFYTLSPPIMDRDTVDSFWLDHQEGFCEHYAGSLVFLARAAGVPARVVIGYQGAEKNPLSDYWIVRYANAHAWTEIWFENQGWVRVDPTAAIAPHRIEEQLQLDYSQRASLFDDFGFEAVDLNDLGWIKQFQYWVDKANTGWNDWILDYNKDSQRKLFDGLGLERLDVKQISLLMIGILAVFLSVISLKWIREKPKLDAIQKSLSVFFAKLSKEELVIEQHQPILPLVSRLNNELDLRKSGELKDFSNIDDDSLKRIILVIKRYLFLRYKINKISKKQQKDFHLQVKALKISHR